MKFILPFILLTSCAGITSRSEFGFGETTSFNHSLQPKGEHIAAIQTGFKIGPEISLTDKLKLDILIGPTITWPLRGPRGRAYNLEVSPRLRWTQWDIEPYVMPFIGPTRMSRRWEGQGTDWGFNLGVAIGARTKISDEYWLFAEYKFWHESNGTKALGHSKGPNPGFNMDLFMIGLEWKW